MSRGEPSARARAVIIGSAVPSFCHGAMPVMTTERTMYSTVQMTRLMMMPNGMSFAGLLRLLGGGRRRVESDVAEEDDRRAGADAGESVRGEAAGGGIVPVDRLDQDACPPRMKNRMIPILSSTMALFEFADSLMPITSTTVITATTRNAGRFAMTGKPKRRGAAVMAEARYWLVASVAPPATASAAIVGGSKVGGEPGRHADAEVA